MANSRIILLTGEAEAGPLAAILSAADGRTDVVTAFTLRHIRDLLARPGTLECPGRYPSVFALYDGAPGFGITVHQMAPKVDPGPIVAADWFDIPPDCDLARLEQLTFVALADKFPVLAPLMARAVSLERPQDHQGRLRSSLPHHPRTFSADEIARRRRACGAFINAA